MEVITMETKAFKELEAKIDAIADFVTNNQVVDNANEDEIGVDSYEVCTFLKISEKTLQRLRVAGDITYSNIRGALFFQDRRNFLNPLYEDSKASCNIYFDRKSGTYKMKDFGNDSLSGDCFFLVGHLNELDCGNTSDFVEILQIIDRDLSLGLSDYNPTHQSKFTKPVEVLPTMERKNKPYTCKEQPLSEQEQDFWKQYWIMTDTLMHYKVCSLREY